VGGAYEFIKISDHSAAKIKVIYRGAKNSY